MREKPVNALAGSSLAGRKAMLVPYELRERGRGIGGLMAQSTTAGVTRRARRWGLSPVGHVTVWFVVGVVLNATQFWLIKALWFGAFAPLGVHALWGILVWAWLTFDEAGASDRAKIGMIVLLPLLFLLSSRIAFMAVQPAYERIVSDLAAGRIIVDDGIARGEAGGVEYATVAGQPGLVAFNWIRGVPDGGEAFVYDASEKIGGVSRKDWSMSPRLADLLGGQPESCERIADPHYYRCFFS